MRISASVSSSMHGHSVSVETDGRRQTLPVPGKADGRGSAVNGGELLFLALATCYCNDVYREAGAGGLRVDRVDVRVSGSFGDRGEPARDIVYDVEVDSPEPEEKVRALLAETDRVAEIQNSVRGGVRVTLGTIVVRRA